MGALALALCAAPDAFAGKWLSQELGATPPLWYEYRASVNDSGVIAASTLSGSLTQPVVSVSGTNLVALTTPAMTGVDLPVVQGAAMDVSANDRVVGFRAAASSGQRQASLWTRNGASWVHRDLHSAVVALRPSDTISAAYGLAPVAAGEHLVAGYRRARINPQALSEPVIWSVTDSAMSAHALPLPAASGSNVSYGIAYGVSELDRAGRRYACGGVGVGGAFLGARCWDITSTASPGASFTHSALSADASVATSVVNRVRTIDLGTGSGEWQGRQTFAVGYMSFTNGGVAGFVWNLTTGAFDIHSAIAPSYDSILSDVTLQRFSASAARANGAAGPIYNGPLVVGAGGATAGRIAASAGPNDTPATVRAISQARLHASAASAAQTATCDMAPQVSGVTGVLDDVSGISRNALHMVGSASGTLVRLTNQYLTQQVQLFVRNAVVYTTSAAVSVPVVYHWAEVQGAPTQQVIWSNSAGCQQLGTGLACFGNISGSPEAQRARRSGQPSATYLQGVDLGASCGVTPVYALADLAVTTNPATNSTVPGGVAEDWRACGNVPAGRGGVTTGANVDVQRDFYHCGACSQRVDAHGKSPCAEGRCNQGIREVRATGVGCWIGGSTAWSSTLWGQGTCYAENQRNPNATTDAYRRVNTRNESCGNGYTTPTIPDPCSVCNGANPTAWSTSTNATCCSSGVARLDIYDRNQAHCPDDQFSYDRNDGRVRGARWKDPRSGWVYRQSDDWSSADLNTCYAHGSGSPHSIVDPGTVNGGYARPRRIDAFFTWPVDVEDWYEASFDDSGDNQPTPKPRARLISRQTYPGTNRRVRMELCLYIDVVDGNRGQVDIKDMRHYAGQARTSTHDGPSHSPAYDARGQCLETDDNGVADIVVYDYDNTRSAKEDAYVHFVVRPKDDISALHCDQTLYTLYYGNDKRAGVGAGTGYDANRTGCVSCCN